MFASETGETGGEGQTTAAFASRLRRAKEGRRQKTEEKDSPVGAAFSRD